jgi:hypothetical protein
MTLEPVLVMETPNLKCVFFLWGDYGRARGTVRGRPACTDPGPSPQTNSRPDLSRTWLLPVAGTLRRSGGFVPPTLGWFCHTTGTGGPEGGAEGARISGAGGLTASGVTINLALVHLAHLRCATMQ